jgi:hypothetical protein
MPQPDISNNKELEALGRKKIIEKAKEAAREAGSRMVPEDDQDIKVLVGNRYIKVILAKGFRAYTDGGARVITSLALQVNYHDGSPSVSFEGDDIMTEADKKVLDLVLGSMPSNYEYRDISITDDPAQDPDRYLVSLEGTDAMGRHTVDKKTGEWSYVTHKHYARDYDAEATEYVELKD